MKIKELRELIKSFDDNAQVALGLKGRILSQIDDWRTDQNGNLILLDLDFEDDADED